ncbi:MAG: hypothetical protein HXY41_13175 [Chloroflexi bacterium]|nr:hypothetical protein [Chloroflexota bacterium]
MTAQAFWLAFAENFENYTWFEQFVPRLEAVTVEDVLDVARRWLRPQNRTVGWFIPTGDGEFDEEEE